MKKSIRILCVFIVFAFMLSLFSSVYAHECDGTEDARNMELTRSAACSFCGGHMWSTIACDGSYEGDGESYFCTWYTHIPYGCVIVPEYYYSSGRCQECGNTQWHATTHVEFYFHTQPNTRYRVCTLPVIAK